MKLKLLLLIGIAVCHGKTLSSKQSTKVPIEFDDVVNSGKFSQRGFGGVWISGNEFTYSSGGNFYKFNVDTEEREIILSQAYITAQSWRNPSFTYSPDRTKILVRYAQRQIFRHSTVSRFSIIRPGTTEPEFKIADGNEIQSAFFSPTSNGLAYIEENNIYFLNLDSSTTPASITLDGVTGVIYNGIPDWVYEEEVLGTDAASWISPDDKHLAFVRFDDTEVKEAVYDVYGDDQYPQEVHLRYPKAGSTNPTVALIIVELASPENKIVLNVPTAFVGADHILGTVFWINRDTLGAIWLNRRQNRGVFVAYETPNFAMKELYAIEQLDGWISLNTPKCDENSVCYFINGYENWPTLTSIDVVSKEIKRLSSTGMNVLSVYGIRNGIPYFLSTPKADEAFNRHVYSTEGCVTCGVVSPEGNTCTYASASFSKDLSHYTMSCSGPDPSFTDIYQTDGNTVLIKWETNEALRATLLNYDLPQKKLFHVPVGGFNAAVKMQLPNEIDFDSNLPIKKYPMLVRVYGGPGSVLVANSFSTAFHSYQTTKKNIIYVEIDGRGTAQKGLDMMFSVNNRLGTFEIEDQLAVTNYLINKYNFIDSSRVGIWGWSYGGYATAMTLAKDTDHLMKCGISVAPVTSWRFYDTIYTERYMGVSSNATNYLESEVFSKDYVKVIGEHDFFLIHGNADDNVHYQQAMVLAKALERADIQFEQLSYPDEAHSISGTQKHLYHSMDRFWDRCFKE